MTFILQQATRPITLSDEIYIRWEKLEDAGYNMEFDYTEKMVILFISTTLV